MKISATLTSLLAVVLLTGCVAGNTHTFNYVPADRSEAGAGKVVLLFAVDDARPYVVSGDEPANFVGEQRNGYGMPFNVTTSDKRPFAAVVQETVQRDLESAGFKVTPAKNKAGNIASVLGPIIRDAGATRGLAIVMNEFKSDTMTNINFDYNFEAIVYDADGNELARDKIFGEDELKGSFMNPVKAAKQKVPEEFYRRIHSLVTNNRTIMAALTQ